MIHYTLYQNQSSSQWVTFVHGAGGSSSIWFKQIRDFQKHYNVLLLDLRGHGNSKVDVNEFVPKHYTFPFLANDILEVLDHLKIQKSHFVGISLGTILIRQFAETNPQRVQSMILGGAILKMNFRSQILMKLGSLFQYVLPYLWLYTFFAFVIMPKNNHKQSRLLFINEAKKLCQKEFMKWYQLTTEINPILKKFRQTTLNIPTLYIMGNEDYMFLPSIRKVVKAHQSSKLLVVAQCGHVVNVEQSSIFNQNAITFLQTIA
ncbi:alpha/beta hydrolase [Flavobacterium sp.]|uniref:alpha/beta fold hydrolase n=1 Tax=Flavobacterium sp. TaxID=239 RepID=UPI00286BF399|nr:alpha/beta hydrolase [Flavobacterium sp.]